jgi:hypothetical protein
MERPNLMLVMAGLLARRGGFTGNALPAEPEPSSPGWSSPVSVILSDDFRVSVQTNRNVYYNKDVLRLTVKLLNDSPYPAFIGVCPIEPTPQEPTEEPTVEIDEGVLDDIDSASPRHQFTIAPRKKLDRNPPLCYNTGRY